MANVSCRLAALDLDGTLLNDEHTVTNRSCEALQKLSAQGAVVVLISGRMHRAILPISDQIGLENPIISYNGGMVKHPRTGEVIPSHPHSGSGCIGVGRIWGSEGTTSKLLFE